MKTRIKPIADLFCAVLVLGITQPVFGQVPAPVLLPRTGVATPPPFQYPAPISVHRNWAEAVADIPEAASHDGSVRRYWSQIASFNNSVNIEYARLQNEANRRGTIACRDYQAVWIGSPGEMPNSITLRPAPPSGPELSAASGSFVDGLSPHGRELERQWLYNTRIGFRTICAIPSVQIPSLNVAPSATAFNPIWGGMPVRYSLTTQPVYTGPSLMIGAAPSFPAPRYSLGVDLSSIGRSMQSWQSSMETRYPWLRPR